MPTIKANVTGVAEARKFLAEMRDGASQFSGTRVFLGTPLPRGLYADVGTRRGQRATHWLSGLKDAVGKAAKRVILEKMLTPADLAEALVQVANIYRSIAAGRAPRATGQLRGSVQVTAARGLSRLGSR